MRANIGKGTEIFSFFGEYFKYIGEYYIVENTDEYWEGLKLDADKLLKKYESCDFYLFARAITMAFVVYQDDVKLHNRTGRVSVEFKGEGQ